MAYPKRFAKLVELGPHSGAVIREVPILAVLPKDFSHAPSLVRALTDTGYSQAVVEMAPDQLEN